MSKKPFTRAQRAESCRLDLVEACYQACKRRRGYIAEIARMNELNENTFSLQVNPLREDRPLHADHVEMILDFTKDPRILDAVCKAHGSVGWFHLPDPNCGVAELMSSIGEMGQEFGALMKDWMESLSNDGFIDADELSQLEKSGAQLISAVQGALEQARINFETFDMGAHGFGGGE